MKDDLNNFINIYENNKSIVKDNSYKTIEKFMNLFKKNTLYKINTDDELDFIINDKIIFKFKEEENYIENIEKEYLILIYLSQKENISEIFFEKILKALIDIFDPCKILLNIKFYKKCFKFFVNRIKNKNALDIINSVNNLNENKKSILIFLYYYNYFSQMKINKDNININIKGINFDYIKLSFDLNNILNLYITKETEAISCQNYFNYLFNKHFFLIKELNAALFSNLINTFLEFLKPYYNNDNNNIADENKNIYENFLYIISFILCPTNDEEEKLIKEIINKEGKKDDIEKIKENILISNNSVLHQISVNLLNKNEKNLDKDFMKKYISIYEVLDGFNCHLFKSLEPEFKSLLLFINSNINKLSNINDYFNLFLLLNRKVFNHDNSRIHKFFIKTICRIEDLTNEIFSTYLFSDFLNNINSPMLYPEKENNIYEYKVGILIKKFLSKYLNFKNNKKFLFEFIHGINLYSTNKKIIPYLISIIDDINIKKNFVEIISNNNKEYIFEDILNIFNKLCIGNNSQYQRFKNFETISNLLLNILNNNKTLKNNNNIIIILIKIYCVLFDYVINFNKDVLSFEYLNLSDISLFDKDNTIFNTLVKLKEFFSDNLIINDDIDLFINNNIFIKNIPYENISLLFFSVNDNSMLNSFLLNNDKKLFSDYLNIEQKNEFINKFNKILLIQKIFLQNKKENVSFIKDIFDNIFITLKNFCNVNVDINMNKALFEKYEMLLFNYIDIYKSGFNDIFINEINFVENGTNFFYKLLFIKMYLFFYLIFLHFEIFTNNKNNKSTLISNTILKNNLVNIVQFLLNNDININESNKILFFKCLVLGLVSLKSIDDNENIINILKKIHEEKNGNKLNINYILNFFDILSKGDLFYVIKFFNIFFEFNDIYDNDVINIYKTFIEKAVKSILENRENFTFLNIITLSHTLLNKKILSKNEYISIIKSTFEQFMDLNEKKIWLLLKISAEVLFSNINEDKYLLEKYQDLIIELSIIKETRGDDSFMIQTYPLYIKSPFNLNIKKILPYREKVAKYGLYIRFHLLNFINDIIINIFKEKKEMQESIINTVLNMINKILERINKMSGVRPEMIFTAKHREKLRLSQLLITLGNLFNVIRKEQDEIYIKNLEEKNKIIFDGINKNIIEIFSKTNLQSVDFYIYNFNLQFLFFSEKLRNYYYESMTNPKTKSHIVSACLIIISIAIVENILKNKDEINKFVNAITIQCTSNICNVRGFAQFFIDKIFNNENLIKNNYLTKNLISESFITYLNLNPNIQKFFSKFDEKYKKYTELLNNFSIGNLLNGNLDEVYCEIVPIDLNNAFKILSGENLVLDNIEFGKISSNWRFVFDNEEELSNSLNKNTHLDFQKKYRPLDINIYHNFSKNRKRHDIIVVASLIDKAPNLGGLTRTCEIFNIGALTIPNESFLKDTAFLRAAASGEKWTPLLSVPPCTVKDFIINYKKMGYKVIGLEQTQNSIDVRKFKFEEKSVIVLGNEKEGIPQDIINLIDNCVIIPQYGNIRSLNVHVSAAIMLWQCVQCLNNP